MLCIAYSVEKKREEKSMSSKGIISVLAFRQGVRKENIKSGKKSNMRYNATQSLSDTRHNPRKTMRHQISDRSRDPRSRQLKGQEWDALFSFVERLDHTDDLLPAR